MKTKFKKLRTGSLIIPLVQKCLCVSISRGKSSIYFLLNIGYVVYVVYFVYAFMLLWCTPCARHAPAMRPW